MGGGSGSGSFAWARLAQQARSGCSAARPGAQCVDPPCRAGGLFDQLPASRGSPPTESAVICRYRECGAARLRRRSHSDRRGGDWRRRERRGLGVEWISRAILLIQGPYGVLRLCPVMEASIRSNTIRSVTRIDASGRSRAGPSGNRTVRLPPNACHTPLAVAPLLFLQ